MMTRTLIIGTAILVLLASSTSFLTAQDVVARKELDELIARREQLRAELKQIENRIVALEEKRKSQRPPSLPIENVANKTTGEAQKQVPIDPVATKKFWEEFEEIRARATSEDIQNALRPIQTPAKRRLLVKTYNELDNRIEEMAAIKGVDGDAVRASLAAQEFYQEAARVWTERDTFGGAFKSIVEGETSVFRAMNEAEAAAEKEFKAAKKLLTTRYGWKKTDDSKTNSKP